MNKDKEDKEKVEAFIAGAETALAMVRENMKGGSLIIFDLHSYQVEDLLRQIKKINKIK